MATSGSFNTSKYDGRYLKFSWTLKSQSAANNTSTISWTLKGAGTASQTTYKAGNFKVVINAKTVYSSSTRIDLKNGTLVASGTYTLKHDSNGVKQFMASAEAGIYTVAANCSGGDSWTLPKINRYATVTQTLSSKTETSIKIKWTSDSTIDYIWYSSNNGSTWKGVNVSDGKSGTYTISGLSANTKYNIKTQVRRKDTQLITESSALAVTTYNYPYAKTMPDFTIGDMVNIDLYNPLERSTKFELIGDDGSIIYSDTGVISNIMGEFNADKLYASIPNKTSGTYKVRITYSGNATTKTGGTYIINRNECKPTIGNVAYRDTNSKTTNITGNNQQIIQIWSTVQYSASGLSAKKSATVKSCKVTVNGNSYDLTLSGASASGGNARIDSGSDVVATFTVTDSRGLTATKDITVQMIAYQYPSAIIELQRKNNFYTETEITVDADCFSLNGADELLYINYKAKKQGTTDYTVNGTLSDNVQGTFNADNNYAWDVVVTLSDVFGGTTIYNLALQRGMPIIYFDRLKSSVGVNCFPQNEKSFEVDGYDMFFHEDETFTLDGIIVCGVLTNYTKGVRFSVTLPKFLNGLSVELTELKLNVWGDSGYTLSSSYVTGGYDVLVDNTITVKMEAATANILHFWLDKTTVYNGTNNRPLAVQVNALTLKFSAAE